MSYSPAYQIQTESTSFIFDALVSEAQHRKGRSFKEWQLKEAQVVHQAATEMAAKHGLRAPSLEEIQKVERYACGHSDYAKKWALYAFELTLAPEPEERIASSPGMCG